MTYVSFSWMLVLLVVSGVVAAQDENGHDYGPSAGEKPDTFRLDLAATVGRVPHSLYNQVEIVDERVEKGELGWLANSTYYGLRVCLAGPLDQQLSKVLEQLTDSTAGAGSLLVEMRRFVVYDDNRDRYASLRFRLFGGNAGLYSVVADVDTTVALRAPMGAGGRRKFAAAVNGALSAALAAALRKAGDSSRGDFTRATIPYADQVWEKQMPLYQTDIYPDGIYIHFSSFAQLRPDYTRLQLQDTAHPEFSLPPQQVYSFVLNGKAYISSDGVYKPLIKKDGEYFIIGKVRVDAPGADAAANVAGFVAAVASMGKLPFVQVWGLTVKKKFLLQLDYRNGQFLPVKPVD